MMAQRLARLSLPGWHHHFSTFVTPRSSPKAEHLHEAMTLVRALASPLCGGVSIDMRLNTNDKITSERVRGVTKLPYSIGKPIRLAVFARGDLAVVAKDAGADLVGAEDLVERILEGRIDFQRCLATPDMMPVLAKVARPLGQKGLMPSPRRGTVVTDVAEAVARVKGGEREFLAGLRVGILSTPIGKLDLPSEHLCANALQLM